MISFSATPFFSARMVTIRTVFVHVSSIGYVSKGLASGVACTLFLDECCYGSQGNHDRQGDACYQRHVIEIPYRLVGFIVCWYSRTGGSLWIRLCDYGSEKVGQ